MEYPVKENEKPLNSVSDTPQVVSIPIHQTGVYTYKEAATLSKCSYVTIWRAVTNGKLKATAVGNQPRIIGAELLSWIEAGGETGRSKATM
ncbi:MAG: helix-turn-helix domain-containing protein [Blastocatellales bacterium]